MADYLEKLSLAATRAAKVLEEKSKEAIAKAESKKKVDPVVRIASAKRAKLLQDGATNLLQLAEDLFPKIRNSRGN